jgi:hypothetical protein
VIAARLLLLILLLLLLSLLIGGRLSLLILFLLLSTGLLGRLITLIRLRLLRLLILLLLLLLLLGKALLFLLLLASQFLRVLADNAEHHHTLALSDLLDARITVASLGGEDQPLALSQLLSLERAHTILAALGAKRNALHLVTSNHERFDLRLLPMRAIRDRDQRRGMLIKLNSRPFDALRFNASPLSLPLLLRPCRTDQ